MVALSTEGKGGASKAVSLGTAVQDTLISPLVDAHLIVGVGDHSVADDVHRLDIPTAPEIVPNKLLRLHIKGCEEEDFGLNLQTS